MLTIPHRSPCCYCRAQQLRHWPLALWVPLMMCMTGLCHDSTEDLRTEVTAAKATQQSVREVGAIVVHWTEVANPTSGEWCGHHSHASLAESSSYWVGCSAKPSEMDARAILSEGSNRQEAPTNAKCGVGCKICMLALGVKKRRQTRVAQDESHISAWEPGYLPALWGRRSSYRCQLALGQHKDILAIKFVQHNPSQPLPKAWESLAWFFLTGFLDQVQKLWGFQQDGWDKSCLNILKPSR